MAVSSRHTATTSIITTLRAKSGSRRTLIIATPADARIGQTLSTIPRPQGCWLRRSSRIGAQKDPRFQQSFFEERKMFPVGKVTNAGFLRPLWTRLYLGFSLLA